MREKQESLLREAQDRLQQLEVERQAANAELQVGGAGCGRGRCAELQVGGARCGIGRCAELQVGWARCGIGRCSDVLYDKCIHYLYA